MLIQDYKEIGNKLYSYRKNSGLTQIEVADQAGLSGRTYADIERGNVNMRVETLLRICKALAITPNDILYENDSFRDFEELEKDVFNRLNNCHTDEKEIAYRLLNVYLTSLK